MAKTKKGKAADGVAPELARHLKRNIEEGRSLSAADVLQLLRVEGPGCPPGCKGRKASPYCLCGIVPATGSFRRKGLWQKDPEAMLSLGPDPATRAREVCCAPDSAAVSSCCCADPCFGALALTSPVRFAGPGAALWTKQLRQHVLREQRAAVPLHDSDFPCSRVRHQTAARRRDNCAATQVELLRALPPARAPCCL